MAKSPLESILSGIWKNGDKIMEIGERFHFLGAVFSAFRGKEPKQDAHPMVHAAYGWSGKGDEIAMQRILLEQLKYSYIDDDKDGESPSDKRKRVERQLKEGEEAIDILTHFIRWAYRGQYTDTAVGRVISWWYLNQLRVLVVKLNTESVKIADISTVVGDKDTKTTRTSAEFSEQGDEAVGFLKHIVFLIKRRGKRVEGYEDALRYFEAWGIPVMPSPEAVEALETWLKNLSKIVTALPDWLDAESNRIDAQRRAYPWWKKILTF